VRVASEACAQSKRKLRLEVSDLVKWWVSGGNVMTDGRYHRVRVCAWNSEKEPKAESFDKSLAVCADLDLC
jgi:hypothetical protein